MDFLFIESRDPIFGLIVLVLSVILVVILSYFWGIFAKKNANEHIDKFLEKFGLNSDKSKILEALGELDASEQIKIATALSKMGDYQNAVIFYEKAIKNTDDLMLKSKLLNELGKAYIKTGFLDKAKEAYESLLGVKTRDKEALFHLIFIYEKMRDFKNADTCLKALEIITGKDEELSSYLKALEILSNKIEAKEKLNKLKNLSQTKLIRRFELELALNNFLNIDEKFLPPLELGIDLLKDNASEFYKNNFTSQSEICEKNLFALKILQACKTEKIPAKLEFNYICKECKQDYPLFFARCPKCLKIASIEAHATLSENKEISQQKADK